MSHLRTSGRSCELFSLTPIQLHWAALEHLRLPHRSSKYSTGSMRGLHPSGETARDQVVPYSFSNDTKHIVQSNPDCLAISDKFSSFEILWGFFWKYTLFWGFVIESKGQKKNSSCLDRRRCTTVHGEFAQNHSSPLEKILERSQLRIHLNRDTREATLRTVLFPTIPKPKDTTGLQHDLV